MFLYNIFFSGSNFLTLTPESLVSAKCFFLKIALFSRLDNQWHGIRMHIGSIIAFYPMYLVYSGLVTSIPSRCHQFVTWARVGHSRRPSSPEKVPLESSRAHKSQKDDKEYKRCLDTNSIHCYCFYSTIYKLCTVSSGWFSTTLQSGQLVYS